MSRPRTLAKAQLCSFWLDLEQRQALDFYAEYMGLSDRSKALRAILSGIHEVYTIERRQQDQAATGTG